MPYAVDSKGVVHTATTPAAALAAAKAANREYK